MTVVNQTKATIYGKPGCVQCNAMKRFLDQEDIQFEYIDVMENEAAYKWVTEMGYQQVPVTVIGFEHFSGFDPDAVRRAKALVLA